MYAHNIIEDLKNKNQDVYKHYRLEEDVISFSKMLMRCHTFFMGTWANLSLIKEIKHGKNVPLSTFVEKYRIYLKLPYDLCLFEIIVNKVKLAYLVSLKGKRFHINVFICDKNSTWCALGAYVTANIESGEIESFGMNRVLAMELRNDTKFQKAIMSAGIEVMAMLVILNCTNIKTPIIQPSTQLNKKRQKRKKQPLLSYHVLEIKNTKGTRMISENGENHNRVHLCRGHFKEYTKEKPLFGRITGLYWWQPYVRGQNKDGIVIKDYKYDA